MDVLDEAATREALRQLPGWEQTGDAVAKTFVFDSFRSAMLFVERIGDSTEGASERAGHHPQIDIRSDRVRIAIPKSDASGVTRADIRLAGHVERLRGEHGHPPGMAGPS
jgi:4a-hydroxytetrahydrobiopterin dehydratase